MNDAPYTIGDLLASLAAFALQITKVANAEDLDIAIGKFNFKFINKRRLIVKEKESV